MRLIQCIFFGICSISLIACNSSQKAFTSIKILEQGFESGGEFCKDFNLEAAKVKAFFEKAEVKTPREIHDEFEYLPCYVQGSALSDQQTVRWEIRAGGTAKIIYVDGRHIELGCLNCF